MFWLVLNKSKIRNVRKQWNKGRIMVKPGCLFKRKKKRKKGRDGIKKIKV